MFEKLRCWIKLSSVKELPNSRILPLVHKLGSPEQWAEQGEELEQEGLLEETCSYLVSDEDPPDWAMIQDLVEEYEINFCTILDKEYPNILKTIPGAPLWLFYRGSIRESDFVRNLAVVGTRKPSSYGLAQCQRFCRELAEQGVVIISGLAFGIDSAAHAAALGSGGRTLAVMGSGVESIYPPANRFLAERIIENGAIISEYLPGSRINMWNFPNRNRIISGLSQGVWVVEGGEKSGSLITARYAESQQKRVFVLPADVNRESARGSNRLLAEGALAVLDSDEIMKLLNYRQRSNRCSGEIEQLNELEKQVYELLVKSGEEVPFDAVLVQSGLKVGELSTILLSLELKGYIRKAAGNRIYAIK